MKRIQFEGGDVLANLEERTVTGLLLPYNEVGRTNVGRIQVEAGTVELPGDPDVIGLNTDHERDKVVGRAVTLDERAEGVFATLRFAKTPEGDAALADAVAKKGKRRKLSAEFGPVVIRGGKLVAGHAKLWGASLVEAGAFPSAQVLAADTPDDEDLDEDEEETDELEDELEEETPDATAAGSEPDATAADTEQENPTVGRPNALAGKKPTVTKPRTDLPQVFAAISALRANPQDETARQVLAALSDIKISGSGALPAAGVLRENWLGQLYQGIPYDRQYITLGTLGTDITAAGKKGYKVHRGTTNSPVDSYASDGTWSGNKSAIFSGTGWSETAASTLSRFAIGEDIAREFYDLPGGSEVVEAFLKLLIEDHLVWSDEVARVAWVTAAGAPVAPNEDLYPEDYSGTIGMLIQGVLAVKRRKADKRRDKPTFAILNDAAYEELAYTPKDLIPEYFKFSVNTDGEGLADGDVLLVNGDLDIEDSPAVLVGAKKAIEFDELAGGPLHVDALDIAKGGIDKAVHGYLQTFPVRSEAVVLIGQEDS